MVAIIPYQETWPAEFREIAAAMRQALGALALRIEHIGSTAVPGLPAKEVIDIQITVAACADRIATVMAGLGYARVEENERDHCPPGAAGVEADWHKRFFRPPPGQRRTNTHVRVLGRANQRYALLVRDDLRGNPAPAQAYAALKRRLAQSLADPRAYPEVKDPAVDLIYFAAEVWAQATHWRAGPPEA